ncbi:MAG: NAD(P)H-hydrate dehydratase [Mesorhizobium sp.]|uniref:NAD(P)H-hydrate dehydratase n=1 Tax=Mesorhizobium sp. TaxID=1871066 RepID=UPI000FE58B61|nr:NAD(P)H-hydrate dehydratase [Mesorhizobium sp.]RWH68676.1 MAG: NAD(P)H-hydrate dehydratase [Mesorhizobium sp.]RWH74883.1 MAG: NAD(P)H-hydrate dehydratase [Mesorhizobium sp.]RWH89295.1 MAG: NAD(P)H-hydrate dehydratase [Mesorhizobium sp.]RWH90636.1 MAG: NAD(P)H-hydrate dehydratase [Mesorhizobium sp.]RWI01379.1 MAG: NAD(P)H-hydrate dehydratase [Mesorhizobium sp.]
MSNEILSPAEMAEADRLTISAGPRDGIGLMRNAGAAVAAVVLAHFPAARRVHVLCGPGNNGGDGYVVARFLRDSAVDVLLWASGSPKAGSDAALAASECPVRPRPLSEFAAETGEILVDALYGAGLSKPLSGDAARAVEVATELNLPVVAVDLPSGVSGESGQILGQAFRARFTVTFARKKPGHLLLPGREMCGELVLADIGIGDRIIAQLEPRTFENTPPLWLESFPIPAVDTHKYRRGHVGVFSGGPSATGAARLSALAAARSGAGAVTVLSPANAVQVNAAHLTSIMLKKADSIADVQEFIDGRRPSAFVLGPGFGVGEKTRDFALGVLAAGQRQDGRVDGLVLDADGITAFRDTPNVLFEAAHRLDAPALVLTPHQGEFARLFADIAGDKNFSKLAKARSAAKRAGAIVVYKGADTVIAAPDGRAAINGNGAPWLATAGSGDVLSGVIAGFLAQGMPAFEAACAAVWIHAEAGSRFGPGLIAEDLPLALVPLLRELAENRNGMTAE